MIRGMKPKVGLMTLSLENERIDLAIKWNKIAIEKLKEKNIEVVFKEELIYNIEDSIKATKEFISNEVDCIIYLIGTWIYVPTLVNAALESRVPILLWSIKDPATFSITGAGIAHGSLDEIGLKHKFIYGSPEDEEILEKIITYIYASTLKTRLSKMKLGLIGGKPLGMYTTMVDMSQIKSLFGVEIEHVDQYRVFLEAENMDERKVNEIYNLIKKDFGKILCPNEKIFRSIRLYHALKKIIAEDKYDFITVKCAEEMLNQYVSYCLAVALLNDDGIVTACEGDINAALTMQILYMLSGEPVVFADVNDIDLKDNVLRLVNCGAIATRLAKSRKDVDLETQYEYMGKQQGCTTVFCCKPGKVTLARLSRIKGKYVMLIATGEAFEQPKEKFKESREKWPHAFIKIDGDIEKLIENTRSNHMHMVYGDYKDFLIEFCKLMDIESIVV